MERINQSDAYKVNGYVVVDRHNTANAHYKCKRGCWGKEVHAMYERLAKTNINCPMVPYEVLKWNQENKEPRIAYFTILDE